MNRDYKITGGEKEVIETLFDKAKNESRELFFDYSNQYSVFTLTPFTDFLNEYEDKKQSITKNIIRTAIDFYIFIKEVCLFNTNRGKARSELPKENFENGRLNTEHFESIFEYINWVKIELICFEILDFLEIEIENFSSESHQIKKNKFIKIFKNDVGYTLFLDLKENYKNTKYNLANYSFIFYALQKHYLVCSGTQFIDFLLNFDISIEKIDNRQSGTNTKTSLFKSFEGKYLPKK